MLDRRFRDRNCLVRFLRLFLRRHRSHGGELELADFAALDPFRQRGNALLNEPLLQHLNLFTREPKRPPQPLFRAVRSPEVQKLMPSDAGAKLAHRAGLQLRQPSLFARHTMVYPGRI
jgi:hypothetical protein